MSEPVDPRAGGPGILSVGHSTHPIELFLRLLRRNEVEVVADVRSSPYSRFNPQFNRENLRRALGAADLEYGFLGKELGGRPDGDEFYDARGHVLYGRVAETDRFRHGLDRLIERAERSRVAIMCSEEDPAGCHRFLLVTGALHLEGVPVRHIRCRGTEQGDHTGTTVERSEDLKGFGIWVDGGHEQRDLFGESIRSPWRSPKPVPRSGGP